MSDITVRIRYAGGTLRITDAKPSWTLEKLKDRLRQMLGLRPDQHPVLSPSPLGSRSNEEMAYFDDSLSLAALDIRHGTMIFMDSMSLPVIPAPDSASGQAKAIDASGNLVVSKSTTEKNAFRPGLQSLRSQKLHWTLTEMTEYDSMYTFVIKGKELLFCASASIDLPSAQAFQQFCSVQGFQKPRASFMYGKFMEPEQPKLDGDDQKKSRRYGETKGAMRVSDFAADNKEKPTKYVMVDALYDPKQVVQDGQFVIDFGHEGIARANAVAQALGLTWVGIAFSHPGDRPFNFSAHEILQTGVACLEATNGSVDSPFVVIKVAPNKDGIQMDAFQLTKTCLEMIKEEALENMPDEPAFFGVNERYQVIVEAKPALVVDTDFFIKRVPIKSHTSDTCTFGFPRVNREQISPNSVKSALGRLYSNPTTLKKTLKDFNLLVYLTQLLGVDTVVEIINFLQIAPQDDPLPEGFQMMLEEVSGH